MEQDLSRGVLNPQVIWNKDMKILFLCMHMSGLHGSVLHILEYAKFFKSLDAEVCIGAVFIDPTIRKIAASENISLYRISNVPLDTEYDIVYALHLFLFPYLLIKGLAYKHAILGLLGVKVPLEQLPPSCMYPYVDLITAISPEIIARYRDEFQLDEKLFTLIPNHLPVDFLEKSGVKTQWAEKIGKLAVVSNHRVEELLEMGAAAPWQTDFFGSEYENSVTISPELLLGYDAIITIGKTVQYGMGLGVPVFEYDYNGGCGWITPDNMESEAKTNFSGRSTRTKRDAATLVRDLAEGYANAASQAARLREKALETFSIIKLITRQIALVSALPPKGQPILSADAWFYANTCYLAVENMIGLMRIRNKALEQSTP